MRVPTLVGVVVVAMLSSTIVASSEGGQRQRGGDRGQGGQGRSEQRRAEPRDRDGGRRASGEGPSPMARPVQEGRRAVERQPQAARNNNSRQMAETRQVREPRQVAAARQPEAIQRLDRRPSNRERSAQAAGVRDPGVVVTQRRAQERTNATQGHFIDLDRGAPNRGSASPTTRSTAPRSVPGVAPTRSYVDRNGYRSGSGSRDGNGYRDGNAYRGGNHRDYNGHRGYKTYNYRGRTYNYYTIYPPPYYYYPYSYGYGPGGRGYFYFDLHYNSHIWYPHTAVRYDSYGTYGYPIGELRLQVRPREAQVFVDGSYAGTVDEFDGTFQSLRLEEGEYQIEIVLEGFEPLVFDVRITPGEKVTYRGDLVPEQP